MNNLNEMNDKIKANQLRFKNLIGILSSGPVIFGEFYSDSSIIKEIVNKYVNGEDNFSNINLCEELEINNFLSLASNRAYMSDNKEQGFTILKKLYNYTQKCVVDYITMTSDLKKIKK